MDVTFVGGVVFARDASPTGFVELWEIGVAVGLGIVVRVRVWNLYLEGLQY